MKELSKSAIEAATRNALAFGTPDISGKMSIEDGVVYFRDRLGHVSLMMGEDEFNAFVKTMKKELTGAK